MRRHDGPARTEPTTLHTSQAARPGHIHTGQAPNKRTPGPERNNHQRHRNAQNPDGVERPGFYAHPIFRPMGGARPVLERRSGGAKRRSGGVKNRARKGPTLEPRSGSKITARPQRIVYTEYRINECPAPEARSGSQTAPRPRRIVYTEGKVNGHPPRDTERPKTCTPPSAHRPHRGQSQRTPRPRHRANHSPPTADHHRPKVESTVPGRR